MTLTGNPSLVDVLLAFQPVWEAAYDLKKPLPRPVLRASTTMLQRLFGPAAPREGWQPEVYWDWAREPDSWRWDTVVTDFGDTRLVYDDGLANDTLIIETRG